MFLKNIFMRGGTYGTIPRTVSSGRITTGQVEIITTTVARYDSLYRCLLLFLRNLFFSMYGMVPGTVQ